MAISMNADSADDLAKLLRGLQGDGGAGATPKPDYIDAEVVDDPKPDPKSEPKPTTSAADPKAEPNPAADTPKSTSDTKTPDSPKAEPKRFSPKVGKVMTQLGVPPSAVRNLKNGEPLKGAKGILKAQWNTSQHLVKPFAEKVSKLAPAGTKALTRTAIKAVPLLGSLYAGYSAIKAFKEGDYVSAALNALGVIPGPVGWVALGASALWDAFRSGGHKGYGLWGAPDGTDTFILQGSAKDVANVKAADATLQTAQRQVFSFQDGPHGQVWNEHPPTAIRLDGDDIKAAVTEYLTDLSDHFAAIDKAMSDAGEQYFSERRQALAPHFAAMAKIKSQVAPLMAELTAVSKAAETAYDAVTNANKAARTQLAHDGTLTDQGPATTMETQVQQALSGIKTADGKIEKLFSESPPAVVLVRNDTGAGTKPVRPTQETKPQTPVTPAAQTPSAVQAPTKTETPTKNDDTLSKVLSQLGQQAKTATPTSNPLGSGSGLSAGSPLGSQGLGGGNTATPLAQSKPETKSDDSDKKKLDSSDRKLGERKEEPKKLGDEKSLSTPKPEQAKAAVPAEQKPAVVPAAAVTAPGTAAPTPAQQNAEAAAKTAEPSKEVDVKGQKTTFPDAKTAKLAELLSKADPTHPVSLADAAKAAGLTPPVAGQDPGTQVNPAQAKPGDIMVAGDKQFMLLGDGKFYDLTDYKIVGAADLPQQLGDRAGYFHLVDPNPGQAPAADATGAATPTAAQAPVSGQTGGVQNPVPNATGANPLPTVGSAPGAQHPVDGSQPAAGAPAASGGVPSSGAPGVPKPAPSGGPANAEGTNTGTGTGGLSSGGGSLDPGAVR